MIVVDAMVMEVRIACCVCVSSQQSIFFSVKCTQVPNLTNGRYSPMQAQYLGGDVVMLACDDGYDLIGEQTSITCQGHNGEWSDDLSGVTCQGKISFYVVI